MTMVPKQFAAGFEAEIIGDAGEWLAWFMRRTKEAVG